MGCHAEFLRVASRDEALPRAVLADPWALESAAPDPAIRALVRLARLVTESPWLLSLQERDAARAAGLDDAAILHAVLLASYFGHLNRLADAVGIELDYQVVNPPVPPDPLTPPFPRAPRERWPAPQAAQAVNLDLRPGAADALAAWRAHVLEREAPLSRPERARIAGTVAEHLGDAAGVERFRTDTPRTRLDVALVALAEVVTLSPWKLGAGTVAALRDAGLDSDLAVFDAISTATSCTTFSRVQVALCALGQP